MSCYCLQAEDVWGAQWNHPLYVSVMSYIYFAVSLCDATSICIWQENWVRREAMGHPFLEFKDAQCIASCSNKLHISVTWLISSGAWCGCIAIMLKGKKSWSFQKCCWRFVFAELTLSPPAGYLGFPRPPGARREDFTVKTPQVCYGGKKKKKSLQGNHWAELVIWWLDKKQVSKASFECSVKSSERKMFLLSHFL